MEEFNFRYRYYRFLLAGAAFGLLIFGAVFPFSQARAAVGVSNVLSYQGRLTNSSGTPVTDGTYYFCFSIWDNVTVGLGTRAWPSVAPTQMSTSTVNGVFNIDIGSGTDSLASFDFSSNDTLYLQIEASSTTGTCGVSPFETLSPRQRIDAVAYARVANSLYGGDARIGTGAGVAAGSQKYVKLDVVTAAETLGSACAGQNGYIWYNTGNGRALICNNNIVQAVGAFSNQYFNITGPTTSVKTFTFPDASATVLTTNTAVTIAQGGTGQTIQTAAFDALSPATTKGDIIVHNGTDNVRVAVGLDNQVLTADSTQASGIKWSTPTGGGSPGGVDTQIQFNDASVFGGDADFTWNKTNNTFMLGGTDTEITIKAITNEPAVPSAGNIHLYAKSIAGRVLPKWVGPSGIDSAMQAFVATNKVAWWNPPGNATTVPGVVGFTALTAVGTATARNVATTNMFTRTRRLGYVSAATAGSLSSQRVAVAQYSLGNGSGLGGFTLVVRFGTSDAATVAGAREFVGMSSATGAPTNIEPSTLTNSIGVGHGAADANLKLYYGGSAAQTPIDLGVNFPANTLSVDMYELILFAPTNTNNTVGYRVMRLNTGAITEGTLTAATPGTQLPASTTLLAYRSWRSNNATALAVGLDIASIYIETDY